MKVLNRLPTSADRKYRKICSKCPEKTFRIWGKSYALCAEHNDEYITAIENLAGRME